MKRGALASLIAVSMLFSFVPVGPTAISPAASANANQFLNVNIPPDLGQAGVQVYFPQTSHSLRGYFLDYWRANGGADVYGYPISEPFASDDGYYSQAFQNGVFQFVLEMVWTDLPSVRLMPIGTQVLDSRLDTFRDDGRRGFGGGDRRSSAWKPVSPDGVTALNAVSTGGMWSEITGHTVSGSFYNWYQEHEGIYYLGQPISQPLRERGLTVQYFEGALLSMDDRGRIGLQPLAEQHADQLGIDTTPIEGTGIPVYNEAMFYPIGNPNPIGDINAPGKRRIEISISEQRLYAYQGSNLITSTLVSTGLSPNDTEIGWFHVRYKLEKQDMAGAVNAQGEVVAMGEEAANAASSGQSPGQEAYSVKDVPHVMYFNYQAEALHGAYWHSNFGNRMSHGCVNLPLDMAQFLYAWAPLGTVVWVYE
jgi:lipoprotein-anchoring transpeptidase ErfK/SrfK